MTPFVVRPRRRARLAPRVRLRPRLEPMEARALLSTLTVTSNADSGQGSLRYELGLAAPGDTIDFARGLKGQTIKLTGGPLTIGVNLTIDGLGANKLIVSGGGTQGVFVVPAGVTATIDGLTVTDGSALEGAGVDNSGNLTLNGDAFVDNVAQGTATSSALGGAIANLGGGQLTTAGTDFNGNKALDPLATVTSGAVASGGAIYSRDGGSISITGGRFSNNAAKAINTWGVGGAIDALGTPITITGATFDGNQAMGNGGAFFGDTYGGALAVTSDTTSHPGSVSIAGACFTNNQVVGDFTLGGAVELLGDSAQYDVSGTITGSQFIGNQSLIDTTADGVITDGDAESGAIGIQLGNLTVTGSTIAGNLTQSGPYVNGAPGPYVSIAFGGGMDVLEANLHMDHCLVVGNTAIGGAGTGGAAFNGPAVGGGIDVEFEAIATVADSTIAGNQAIGGAGGGIGLGGGLAVHAGASLTVSSSQLTGNQAVGGAGTSGGTSGPGTGGGIAVGALFEQAGPDSSTLTLDGSSLNGNAAVGGRGSSGMAGGTGTGGGVSVYSTGAVTIDSTTLSLNRARGGAGGAGGVGGDGQGGGVGIAAGSVTVQGAWLVANLAQGGAGANGGDGLGGGLYVGAAGAAALTDAVITLNAALGGQGGAGGSDGQGLGGGLYAATGSSVTLKKSHVALNSASTAGDDIYGTVTFA